MEDKEYTGSCYIVVVGSENEYGPSRDSIEGIVKRYGDEGPKFIRATKGYEARQMHLNNWYEKTDHPFILFLDSDMLFPPDTLDKLRSHKKPLVSGFYMRRTFRPVYPVWFERGEPGVMPRKPLVAVLETDKNYPIGASGWGCMLVHRDVITAMKPILKGELEIIEDDMDVYPYDLQNVIKSVGLLKSIIDGKAEILDKAKTVRLLVNYLASEIRPLRGIKDEIVGSDIRFPFFAQQAGFELLGDTGVCCEHITNYPITIHDWLQQPGGAIRDISLAINEEDRKEREKIRKATA